jgi:hypothetical protein
LWFALPSSNTPPSQPGFGTDIGIDADIGPVSGSDFPVTTLFTLLLAAAFALAGAPEVSGGSPASGGATGCVLAAGARRVLDCTFERGFAVDASGDRAPRESPAGADA